MQLNINQSESFRQSWFIYFKVSRDEGLRLINVEVRKKKQKTLYGILGNYLHLFGIFLKLKILKGEYEYVLGAYQTVAIGVLMRDSNHYLFG
jgi:hypothetical protein